MSQYLTDMVPCNYRHSASSLLHTDVVNENFTICDMHEEAHSFESIGLTVMIFLISTRTTKPSIQNLKL